MIESFRWFGPTDKVTLPFIKQAGATQVVTALHQTPNGEVWRKKDIEAIKAAVQKNNLEWQVIESIPIHENIKLREGDYKQRLENYKKSLRNAAAYGLKVVCYNYMPVLDWTRTDLFWPLPNDGTALRFDTIKMALFEGFILGRKNAEEDYHSDIWAKAAQWNREWSQKEKDALTANILKGLPGTVDDLDLVQFMNMLNRYKHISTHDLKQSLSDFLNEIVPVAEELGMVMAIHPDDPPKDILGLPRVIKNQEDLNDLVDFVDSDANGITFCTGSLGANSQNDLPSMIEHFADRIHFLHLRNVKREINGSFFEDDHLAGSSSMPNIVNKVLQMEAKRGVQLPMRPDHGHQLAYDLEISGQYAGYSLIGRLKGLAEIRGLVRGIQYSES